MKKELNKRLRRMIGDDNSDPNRRETFINDSDQRGPNMPNNNPDDDKKVDDEEAKVPTDGTNNYSSADKPATFAERGKQMVKDSKEGFKMVKKGVSNLKKSAKDYMQPSDKEQTKNAYQYAQLDQSNKTAGKDQTNG